MNQIRVSLERRFLRDSVCLYLFDRQPGGKIGIAQPIVFVDHEMNSTITDPAIEISNEAAQSLFDELYRMGYRPKGEPQAGELAATQTHLSDQRALSKRILDMLERKIFEPPNVVFGEIGEIK